MWPLDPARKTGRNNPNDLELAGTAGCQLISTIISRIGAENCVDGTGRQVALNEIERLKSSLSELLVMDVDPIMSLLVESAGDDVNPLNTNHIGNVYYALLQEGWRHTDWQWNLPRQVFGLIKIYTFIP